ncbi:MAG: hypothetical protein ACM37W_17715 [Actinomycetota bacterium]
MSFSYQIYTASFYSDRVIITLTVNRLVWLATKLPEFDGNCQSEYPVRNLEGDGTGGRTT